MGRSNRVMLQRKGRCDGLFCGLEHFFPRLMVFVSIHYGNQGLVNVTIDLEGERNIILIKKSVDCVIREK